MKGGDIMALIMKQPRRTPGNRRKWFFERKKRVARERAKQKKEQKRRGEENRIALAQALKNKDEVEINRILDLLIQDGDYSDAVQKAIEFNRNMVKGERS